MLKYLRVSSSIINKLIVGVSCKHELDSQVTLKYKIIVNLYSFAVEIVPQFPLCS